MDITKGAIIDVIELPRNSRPLPLSCILFEPTKFCSVDYSTGREVGADNVESMHTGPSPFATVDYN